MFPYSSHSTHENRRTSRAKESGNGTRGGVEEGGSRARRGRFHQKFNPYEYSLFRRWEGSGSSKRGVKRFVEFSRRCRQVRGVAPRERMKELREGAATEYAVPCGTAKQKKGGSRRKRGGKEGICVRKVDEERVSERARRENRG